MSHSQNIAWPTKQLLGLLVIQVVTVVPWIWASITYSLTQHNTGPTGVSSVAPLLKEMIHGIIVLVLALAIAGRKLALELSPELSLISLRRSISLFVTAIISFGLVLGLMRLNGIVFDNVPAESNIDADCSKLLTLILVVYSPVIEETIVRAYLIRRLQQYRFSNTAAALVSATLQLAYHVHVGLSVLPAYFAMFLVFSVAYAKHRCLMSIILAHFYIDLIWWLRHT